MLSIDIYLSSFYSHLLVVGRKVFLYILLHFILLSQKSILESTHDFHGESNSVFCFFLYLPTHLLQGELNYKKNSFFPKSMIHFLLLRIGPFPLSLSFFDKIKRIGNRLLHYKNIKCAVH